MVDPVLGRYAFLAADPFGRLVVRDGGIDWNGQLQRGDAFEALKRLMGQYRTETIAGLPRSRAGDRVVVL